MLQKLRDGTSGWVATAIIVLLMIPFLLVIDQSYLGGMGANNVAQVKAPPKWWQGAPEWWPVSKLWEHREVGVDEFRQRFEQERQRQRQEQGEAFDPRQFETVENKRLVLDQLIDEKVLQLAASRAGVTVGDAAVTEYIASIPEFQVEGKFDLNRYQLALAGQVPALTPTQFEQRVRQSLQQGLVPTGLATSAFVTEAEFDRIVRLSGEQRDLEVVVLPAPAEDTAPVDAAQIQAWYQEHPGDFMRPETVTIEYIQVDASQLPAPAPADEATRKAAEEKARQLAAQAQAPGADFAALARANTEDPGSRDSGGDLGWVERGMMVAPFEDALFSMQPGEVRGPVQTDFGWHVLQLRELKQGEQVDFEQVREELAREQAQADRERAFSELTGRLTDLVYQNPSSLAPAAEQLGLQVHKLGPFSRTDTIGIGASPEVKKAAFSEALIEDGTASDPIQIAPDQSVVIRVLEHAPEQVRPLEEVGEQVVAAIRADRQHKAALAAADALVERLRAGEAMADIAAAEKLEVMPVPGLPRGAPVPSPQANAAIFAAQPAAEGKPAAGRVDMPDQRQAVFVVNAVHPGDPAKLEPGQRSALRSQLEQIQGMGAAEEYVRAMRKRYKVQVEESQL